MILKEEKLTKKEIIKQKQETVALKRRETIVLLFSVFLMSFAVLSFEISLTRMFSVMFAYHYVFLSVAVAFAGLGLGGILVQLAFAETPKKGLFTSLTVIYSLFALAISFITIITISSPSPNFIATAFLFFLSFMPAGLFLATAYKFFVEHSNVIYAADIAGASLGSITIVVFLNGLNPIFTVLLICSALAITALLIALFSSKKVFSMAMIIFLITISTQYLFFYSARDVPTGSDQGKELYEILQNPALGARIVESRWSAFGRTDLVELQNAPHFKVIFVDGGAGTKMYHFNGDFADNNTDVPKLLFSTAAFPFYFKQIENMLIIGPGGGVDVLTALMFNSSHIHAVEINAETVNMVKDYSDYNGGIYTNYSNVHVHVDEGRNYLKRTTTKYDIIMLNIPVTKTTQGTTGYSMAENYLFTTDSFRDYLEHLNDDGELVIVAHELFEVYKLAITALQALSNEGVSIPESMQQLVIVENMQHPQFPVLILKKTQFTPQESNEMLEKSRELGFNPVFFPHSSPELKNYLDPWLVALAEGRMELSKFISEASRVNLDIGPPNDDRPFFYKFEGGLPSTLTSLLIGFSILTAIVTVAYLLNWGRRLSLASKKEKYIIAEKFSIFTPYYFASLGVGFMLIEVALIQKFILFLGMPTLAIAATLFSLLVSMALGGLSSKRWKDSRGLIWKITLLIGVMIILYVFLTSFIFDALLGLDLSLRSLAVFSLTFPLGFLLGIPFPIGMRILSSHSASEDVTWMWGINSLYSVVGSTLAVVIAMSFGFSMALLLGAALYIMISLISRNYFKS